MVEIWFLIKLVVSAVRPGPNQLVCFENLLDHLKLVSPGSSSREVLILVLVHSDFFLFLFQCHLNLKMFITSHYSLVIIVRVLRSGFLGPITDHWKQYWLILITKIILYDKQKASNRPTGLI